MKRTVKLQKVFEDHGGNLSQTSKFRQYFELYDKNKLDKANAWNYEAIDLLSAMNETQKVTNYRFWGQCLVVATKVFSLRVDSLYDDVFRLGSLFTRTANFLNRLTTRMESETEINSEKAQNHQHKAKGFSKKKTRTLRRTSTVTNCVESLNAKLETLPGTDPFFAKLSASVGDTEKANRMLTHLLPTRNSSFLSIMNGTFFWDSSEQAEDIEVPQSVISVPLVDIEMSFIRTTWSGLKLSGEQVQELTSITYVDLLSDEDCEAPTSKHFKYDSEISTSFAENSNFHDSGNQTMSENFSFDATMLDDEDEMSREPEMSVKSSKLLYIDDMEPSNLTQLEYSYQPDELITNFYFGPSHWKFLSKRTGNIKTRSRKKTTPQVTLEEILAFKRKDSSLILKSGRFNSLKKVCSSPKEQLLLPEDFQQTLNSLKGFNYSVLTFNDPINYGLPETSDFEMTFDDVDMNMTEADFQCLKETSSPNTNSSMKTPMTHEPISLNVLAHRSRNFNMKKLKSLALAVIDSEIQENNYVTFRLVHTKVHKMLCESCETPSCALSFLSILISASEVKLKIMKQNDDLNDFSIELF